VGKKRGVAYYGQATQVTANLIPDRFVSPRASVETSDYTLIKPVSEINSRVVGVTRGGRSGLSLVAGFRDEVGVERKLNPSNTSQEWRTPPLWGVRDSAPYLHDGRAETILEAISLHGGESAGTRDRFLQLPVAYRSALIQFLETLVAPPGAPEANL
jgi:hypothetical protein